MLEFDNQVGSEDTALVEAVQRGAGSGGLDARPPARADARC